MSVEVKMFRNGPKLVLRLLLVHIGLIFPLETSKGASKSDETNFVLDVKGIGPLYSIWDLFI